MIKSRLRKFVSAIAAIGLALSVANCAGLTGSLQSDVATIEGQVQADANVLCGFIPTAATIAAFIPGFGTVAASAATIATGICGAIAAAPVVPATQAARLRSIQLGGADVPVATVRTPNGPVTVSGHFTR
jgi:hypothetical protein